MKWAFDEMWFDEISIETSVVRVVTDSLDADGMLAGIA